MYLELPLFPKMRSHPRPVTTILVRWPLNSVHPRLLPNSATIRSLNPPLSIWKWYCSYNPNLHLSSTHVNLPTYLLIEGCWWSFLHVRNGKKYNFWEIHDLASRELITRELIIKFWKPWYPVDIKCWPPMFDGLWWKNVNGTMVEKSGNSSYTQWNMGANLIVFFSKKTWSQKSLKPA